jgi:hypothetical protein
MQKLTGFLVFCAMLWWGGAACAQAPVLSGTWLGKLEQSGKPLFTNYRLRLELKQEGTRVTGLSYIHLADNSELYAKMKLEGRYEKGVFTFHELELLDSRQQADMGWCLKRGELTLRQVGEFRRLEGPWEGYMDDFPCLPGTMTLEKLNPQPKNATADPMIVPVKPVEAKGDFGTVQGRKITHRKEITVPTKTFKVLVWDGDKVDGDIISLQYNGQWLLQKYTISKTKKELLLEVVEGAENQLILYAENEGQYPPNTAAITFFDGTQERNLSLSSDKSTCGALKFVVGK